MDNKSLFGLIIITTLVIWGLVAWGSQPSQKTPATTAQNQLENVSDPDELVLGSRDADVQIVEYSDPQCPACALANEAINDIIANNQGKVMLLYRHFPLSYHQFAKQGARAMQAANRQGKFKEMKDILFQNQEQISDSAIANFAEQIGLDMTKYQEDYNDPKIIAKVESDFQKGLEVKIDATPTVFLNGTKFESWSDPVAFQKQIDGLLK